MKKNANKVIVQKEWDEDDDKELHDYLKETYPEYQIMTKEEILKLDPNDILIPLCDTNIVQELLKKIKKNKEFEMYPNFLSKFLKRDIKIIKAFDVLDKQITGDYNYFIKPISNDKSFNGSLICSDLERDLVLEEIEESNKGSVKDLTKCLDQNIYFCKEVKFVNEYRIFVADGEMFGIVDCSEFLIDEKNIVSEKPPTQFIKDILKNNEYKYCIIDISKRVDGEWCLVEINPPYALMSYGFPIDQYIEFCRKAWNSLII
jgi:hypothetical protein